jgi:hypothetical protein
MENAAIVDGGRTRVVGIYKCFGKGGGDAARYVNHPLLEFERATRNLVELENHTCCGSRDACRQWRHRCRLFLSDLWDFTSHDVVTGDTKEVVEIITLRQRGVISPFSYRQTRVNGNSFK